MKFFCKSIFFGFLGILFSGVLSAGTFSPVPAVENRSAWEKVKTHPQWKNLLEIAEKQRVQILEDPFPYYMDFRNKGDRRSYQKRLFAIQDFGPLAIVYCATKEKKWLRPIEKRVEMLLALPTWVLPAHYSALNCQTGNTDVIDINAASIAGELAMLLHILGPELKPSLAEKLKAELLRRIVIPWEQVLAGDHYIYDWMERNDNWNAVCISGCAATFLMLDLEKERKDRLLELALRKSDHFLSGFGSDGYCSEGISYWYYGFGHFLQFAETVKRYNGKNPLTSDVRAKMAARYPERIKITQGCYPTYADASPAEKVYYLELRDLLLGKRKGFSSRVSLVKNKDLSRLISILFAPVDERSAEQTEIEVNTVFDQAQVYVGRETPACSMGVSFKGGHNQEFHNHNDIGSYIVAIDGISLVLDPGTEIYTARTFSNRRYESRLIGSYGHSVPRIDGKEQTHLSGEPPVGFTGKNTAPAAATSAKILQQSSSADSLTVRLDYRAAYNYIPGITKLERNFNFSRRNGGSFVVTDTASFEREVSFEGAVVTEGTIRELGNQRYEISLKGKTVILEVSSSVPIRYSADLIRENTSGKRIFRRMSFTTVNKCRNIKMTFKYFTAK